MNQVRKGRNSLKTGAPGKTRTSNPQIRSLVLYPIELRAPRQRRGCSEAGGGVQGLLEAVQPVFRAKGGTNRGAVSQGNSTHVSCGTSMTQVSATLAPSGLA